MEGESPLLKEGALSLQTSLSHRELPPRAPDGTWQRVVSLCTVRVLLGEVFCFGREVIFLKVRLSRWFCGWGAYGVCVFCKCRLIPPHQSLTRQTACSFLPPKGKPFYRVQTLQIQLFRQQDTANNTLDFRPFILLCSAKGILQKGFPSGGSCRASD